MKILMLLVSLILFTIFFASLVWAEPGDAQLLLKNTFLDPQPADIEPIIPASPETDPLTKEALKRAAKKQREFFEELFPKPEKSGKGWLLPWQIPKPPGRHTEESFWQQPWAGESKSKMETAAILVELSPNELDKYLDAAISEAKREIPNDFLPPGITVERFVLGTALLAWRAWNSSDLKGQSLLLTRAMAEMAKLTREALEKTEDDDGDDDKDGELNKKMSMVVLNMILEPLKGLGPARIRETLKSEVQSVQEMTAMTYMKCDDWKRLATQDAGGHEVHLGTLAIGLVITEPESLLREKGDLVPEQTAALASKLSGHIENFKQDSIKAFQVKARRKIEKLEVQIKENQRLEQEIEATKRQADAKMKEYQSLKRQIESLKRKLADAGSEASRKSIRKEIEQISKYAGAKLGEHSKLRGKIDQLKMQLKDSQMIRKEIEEIEKESKVRAETYRSLKMKVSCLDVGDNCYAVEMTGKGVDDLETPFPFSLNNVRLRNGNAVVSIGLGGNYPAGTLESDSKNTLWKMDGVTGFFRK